MSKPYPDEILKHCLACRKETLHRRQPLTSVAIYSCTGPCGFPGREVTDPWSCTPAAKTTAAAAENAQKLKWAKESARDEGKTALPLETKPTTTGQAWRRGVRKTHCVNGHAFDQNNTGVGKHDDGTDYRICKVCRAEKNARYYNRRPMSKTSTPAPALNLREKIREIVTETIGPATPGLTREDVIEIVREELAAAFGSAPAKKSAPTENICPRGKHRGPHGQACRDAGYVG